MRIGSIHWGRGRPRPRKIRFDLFIILNSQFSILNSQFSILNSQFSILNSQFSILNSHELRRASQFDDRLQSACGG